MHSYYKSGSTNSKEHMKSAADAVWVTTLLGGMLDNNRWGRRDQKVETLNKLSDVAHQSFEETLYMELKMEGSILVKDKKDVSPVQKI